MASLENCKALRSCLKGFQDYKRLSSSSLRGISVRGRRWEFCSSLGCVLVARVDRYSIVSSRCPLGGVDCNTARLFDAFLFAGDDGDTARIHLKSTKMCRRQLRSSCSRVGQKISVELDVELG